MNRGMRALVGVFGMSALGVCFVLAGPLDPPTGPVTSTGKTLVEVEPRIAISAANTPGNAGALHVISVPGSYYLASNLAVPPGRSYGIEVTASDVTIDLNGFTITGQGVAVNCIRAGAGVERLRVSNGTLAGSASHGVSAAGPLAELEAVTAVSCGGNGMDLGDMARVSGCAARGNGAHGIRAGNNSRVSGCLVVNNTVTGIEALAGSWVGGCVLSGHGVGVLIGSNGVVTDCRVTAPNTSGAMGFWGPNSTGVSLTNCSVSGGGGTAFLFQGGRITLTNCSASGLTTNVNAFEIGRESLLVDCRSENNAGTGFYLFDRCTARNCVSLVNGGNGFTCPSATSATFIGCAAGNNLGSGFSLGDGATVQGCSATNNTGRGIAVANGGVIENCLTRNNQSHGVEVNFSCTVVGNNCNGDGTNAASGIHAIGQANRIEGNNISYANVGMLVDSGGNIIIRTTAKGNAQNYFIAAGNAVAPIVIAGTNPGVINGSAYTGNLGTTDPNANFSY